MSKGTYCLVMRLDEDRNIGIGTRPPVVFPSGFYCYVGSAMNSLEKRTGRHMSRDTPKGTSKRFHWHIDWFLEHAMIVDVKSIESKNRLECGLSRDIARLSDRVVMKGFGSSDCSCETHLHYFRRDPSRELDGMVRKWKGLSGPTRKTGKG